MYSKPLHIQCFFVRMENPAELDNCSFYKYYTLDLNGIHYLYDQNAVHIGNKKTMQRKIP